MTSMKRKQGTAPLDVDIRRRIDAGQAVNVLNDTLNERRAPCHIMLGFCKLALSKVCPDLQAVAIAVKDERPMTRHDIDALLMSAGLQPDVIFGDVLEPLPDMAPDDHDSMTAIADASLDGGRDDDS